MWLVELNVGGGFMTKKLTRSAIKELFLKDSKAFMLTRGQRWVIENRDRWESQSRHSKLIVSGPVS